MPQSGAIDRQQNDDDGNERQHNGLVVAAFVGQIIVAPVAGGTADRRGQAGAKWWAAVKPSSRLTALEVEGAAKS